MANHVTIHQPNLTITFLKGLDIERPQSSDTQHYYLLSRNIFDKAEDILRHYGEAKAYEFIQSRVVADGGLEVSCKGPYMVDNQEYSGRTYPSGEIKALDHPVKVGVDRKSSGIAGISTPIYLQPGQRAVVGVRGRGNAHCYPTIDVAFVPEGC